MGGDDYVTKPFSLDELLGRIRAVLKRTRPDAPGSRLRVADLELDEDAHEVRRDGAVVALTPTEYRLLRFLMVNAGRVVSKGQILDQVWEHDDPGGDGSVVEPCRQLPAAQGRPGAAAADPHGPRIRLRAADPAAVRTGRSAGGACGACRCAPG